MQGFIKFNNGVLRMSWPVKIWLFVLVAAIAVAPLFFLQRVEAQAVLAAMMIGATLMSFLTARFGLGRCEYRLGAREEAVSSFERVLEVDPRNALALREIAKIDLEEGRVDLGAERLRKVVEIEPQDADGWYQLSLALARSGQRDEAETAVEEYKRITTFNERFETRRKELDKDPNNLDVLNAIFADFLDSGIKKEAVFWAKRILEIDPRNELALRVVRGAPEPKK